MDNAMSNRHNGRRRGLRVLCPGRYCHTGVTEITVEELKESGVEAVLLDLDNTLVGWQRSDISREVLEWLDQLKRAGFKLCLVSNTRFGRRLRALSERLEIPYVRRAWKPRKKGFLEAMQELGVEPSKTVMIGDQMFTDVLGGNRVGVFTYMVKPMAKREFLGTKISRVAESVLLIWFRRRGDL
jgi:HAD superfamily phosphatase (TIGR01668 family)